MRKFKGRCLTCKHWEGDRKSVYDHMRSVESESMMDIHDGFATEGECRLSYDWCGIEIRGHATAELQVEGNFGCIRWEDVK